MFLTPAEFMIASVVSVILIFFLGLFLYLALVPCPSYELWFKADDKNKHKKKTSFLVPIEADDKLYALSNNPLQCPHGCCIGVPSFPPEKEPLSKQNSRKLSVVSGPQGHGFYTSGPWKVDAMAADQFTQFSNHQLIMSEIFASVMSSNNQSEGNGDDETSPHFHNENGLMISHAGNEDEDDPNDDVHPNDYAFMDMDMASDADMVIMMF